MLSHSFIAAEEKPSVERFFLSRPTVKVVAGCYYQTMRQLDCAPSSSALARRSTLEHRALVLFRFGPSLPTNRSNVKKQTQDFNLYVAPKTSVDLLTLPSVPSVLAVPRFKRKGTSEPYEWTVRPIRPNAMPHHEHRARPKPYRLESHPHTYTFCTKMSTTSP